LHSPGGDAARWRVVGVVEKRETVDGSTQKEMIMMMIMVKKKERREEKENGEAEAVEGVVSVFDRWELVVHGSKGRKGETEWGRKQKETLTTTKETIMSRTVITRVTRLASSAFACQANQNRVWLLIIRGLPKTRCRGSREKKTLIQEEERGSNSQTKRLSDSTVEAYLRSLVSP
jgi:hypothetical protein